MASRPVHRDELQRAHHRRREDGWSSSAGLDAIRAPARAIRFRPDSCGGNGRHTADDYRRVSRAVSPSQAETSHFHRILSVGFPGETEEDFRATLALVTQMARRLFVQIFAARDAGCRTCQEETVSAVEMDERLARLQELIDSQQSALIGLQLATRSMCCSNGRRAIPLRDRRPHTFLFSADACPSADLNRAGAGADESLERYSLLGQLMPSTNKRGIDLIPLIWPRLQTTNSQMTTGA